MDKKKNSKIDKKKFKGDLELYSRLNKYPTFKIEKKYLKPYITEWRGQAGTAGYYFWQDLWGADRVNKMNPTEHYDIGSKLDGFIAHLLSAGRAVTMMDIRPLPYHIPGLKFIQCDATNLNNVEDDSIESLSALCSIEHFGLGRYGDPIDPDACFKAFKAIERVVKPKGRIYISVPIGREHVEFNAHRVFYPETIIHTLTLMTLVEFTVVNEKAEHVLEVNCDIHKYDSSEEVYAGLFIFEKKEIK